MRSLFWILLLTGSLGAWAQSSPSPPSSSPAGSQAPDGGSSPDKPVKPRTPNLEPPHSDRVNADSLEPGESSSKDTQIDLSPPVDDAKVHPKSSEVLMDEGSGTTDTSGFRYFDPHKAAKNIEVGDFYFKRRNYRAAEDRYREALLYKDNDAMATFRLAVCLEKLQRPEEARQEYESYLKILPYGPQAEDAKKAMERLKTPAASAKPAK